MNRLLHCYSCRLATLVWGRYITCRVLDTLEATAPQARYSRPMLAARDWRSFCLITRDEASPLCARKTWIVGVKRSGLFLTLYPSLNVTDLNGDHHA